MDKISPIWHPLTQHGLGRPEIFIESARGPWLHAADGRRILDGISSWWVITHGHCHPKIVSAVQAQAARLDQVIFAGFTHGPAEDLAAKLLDIAGPSLEHVFFSDSGSTAVEVALKMAIGFFAQTGRPRRKIAALEGGYHGDTFGGMAAGGRGVFSRLYEPYLFEVEHLPFPATGQEHLTLQRCEDLLKNNDVAALILEPLVQGASGMRMYGAGTLRSLHDICRRYGTLLIADEVMTGFGRTGSLFACQQAGIAPDLLCLSKGLTGGFLPMGAALATSEIYRAFYGKERGRMFFHSTSFTGNPLACAAALASLEIWEKEPVLEKIAGIAAAQEKAAARFALRKDVSNVRSLGTILALEAGGGGEGYLSNLAPLLYEGFIAQDALLRPIGNTVYILPPYCIAEEELDRLYDVIGRSLDRIRDEGSECGA